MPLVHRCKWTTRKVVGNPVENDDEDAMVGVVVLDVDGEPRWTGNVGAVAAVKGTAVAASQSEETWLHEVVVAAAGPVVAMATAADCLEEDVHGECDEHPDAKAKAPSDVA